MVGHSIQSEEIKRDPEMDKSAVWAGSGCMAVFPISGSRLISPPGTRIPSLNEVLEKPKQRSERDMHHLIPRQLSLRSTKTLRARHGNTSVR